MCTRTQLELGTKIENTIFQTVLFLIPNTKCGTLFYQSDFWSASELVNSLVQD